MRDADVDAVVVGAGLAGLACAGELARAGHAVRLVEGEEQVGGRVRTDEVEGYRLDRGFQVLLTAYPEARRLLDYGALDLRAFVPGALVRTPDGRAWCVGDPLRVPGDALSTLRAPVGSWADKLRILRWRGRVKQGDPAGLLAGPDGEAMALLREELGFGEEMVERFLRPFLAGIFLDPELRVSRRMVNWVWRMLAEGETAVPARGIGAIAEQLAQRLPEGVLRLGVPVEAVEAGGVRLASGEWIGARQVVVATGMDAAAKWFPEQVQERGWRGVRCIYYAAEAAPLDAPRLVLNGEGRGPINNLHVVSTLAPECAPAGRALISVTVLGGRETGRCAGEPPADDEALERRVREQLVRWFGAEVTTWERLASYWIPRAQPRQEVGMLEPAERLQALEDGVLLCGDHLDQSSIQGALRSGTRAAEAACARLEREAGSA